jgi:GTPase involved in cell partitioning and DNA repair
MREFERELRDMFTIKGELDLYNELIAERNKIVQAREAEIRAAKKAEELKAAKKRRKMQVAMQEMEHAVTIVFAVLALLVAIIGTIAITMSYR